MMLVVNRTRGSSATATCATTYGGGRSGKPNRWLTVKADSVPLPETSRTPMSRLRQYRHTGAGGWISAWQLWHSWMRRTPSAPAVQKNSFSGVSCGSGRRAMSKASAPRIRDRSVAHLDDRVHRAVKQGPHDLVVVLLRDLAIAD